MVPSNGASNPISASKATIAAPMITLGLRTTMPSVLGLRATGGGFVYLGGQGLDAQ